MRLTSILFVLLFALESNAQMQLPASINPYSRDAAFSGNYLPDSIPAKKWSLTRYTGISTSFLFSKYGSVSMLSVPLRLQLNRRLNNNLYAFGALSVSPAYLSFNRSFLTANTDKPSQNNGFANAGKVHLFSRAEMGLMYINDAKTFSISGSIGIEKNNYSLFFPDQISTPRPPVIAPKRL